MFIIKRFTHGIYSKVYICNDTIQRIELYDGHFTSAAFILGWIMGKKTNLCTGWTSRRDFDHMVVFSEALMECHHIFDDNASSKDLRLIGYNGFIPV